MEDCSTEHFTIGGYIKRKKEGHNNIPWKVIDNNVTALQINLTCGIFNALLAKYVVYLMLCWQWNFFLLEFKEQIAPQNIYNLKFYHIISKKEEMLMFCNTKIIPSLSPTQVRLGSNSLVVFRQYYCFRHPKADLGHLWAKMLEYCQSHRNHGQTWASLGEIRKLSTIFCKFCNFAIDCTENAQAGLLLTIKGSHTCLKFSFGY